VANYYRGNIVGGNFYNGPILFQSLNAFKAVDGGSVNAALLILQPLDRLVFNNVSGNEWVLVVGRTFDLDTSADVPLVRINCTVMYDALQPIQKANDVITSTVRIELPRVQDAMPYFQVWNFAQASKKFSPEGGGFFAAGLIRHQPLAFPTDDGRPIPSVDIELRYGHSFGVFKTQSGPAYITTMLSRRLAMSDSFAITPQVGLQRHVGGDRTGILGKGTQFAAQVSMTWKLN
jgi:hypothetical protein